MNKSDSNATGVLHSPGLHITDDEPVFNEPWEAQAFALTVSLHEQNLFSWSEWASYLSSELKGEHVANDGSDYYTHWLSALQKLLIAKQITEHTDIEALSNAWQRAANATPHGVAIELKNDPEFSGH